MAETKANKNDTIEIINDAISTLSSLPYINLFYSNQSTEQDEYHGLPKQY